jgi:hypothetical protein
MFKILSIAASLFFLYRLLFAKPKPLNQNNSEAFNSKRSDNAEVIDIDYEEVE